MGKVRSILQLKGNAVFTISPSHTVYDALELLVEKNIGALMVVDNERFVGIFTERDYARKVILKGRSSKETLIGEIMTSTPVSVTIDDSIEHCMKLMTNKFIRHLPVVENDKLAGLISIGDVVKYIIDEQKFIIENLEHYISGQK
ncbi:CBS domain-containing protein [Solitalea canadensis]|uniref:Putative signal-transduction protein containing cAMP-binding and CBS domains n=1 Tax=Solitalea canadensis (strain ATCC 29591 / DSM 3403 / JCM 21819 / LMG 8368 / NBRC 15130 / NCIMB 12057 / USAM 9D) TaxID=929556 RepID=H8KWJ2_SOLCM|nr:CBS domain-containing protein [Solitalea canadensis]AFD08110.1 putative signal-transduction protein containing cAMP-binding and CBS domains [Solitalea canadensis DSM 3403]